MIVKSCKFERTQMQGETVPDAPADDERGDSVPQRGVDDAAAHHMERHQPLAARAAARDHTRRRRQRER